MDTTPSPSSSSQSQEDVTMDETQSYYPTGYSQADALGNSSPDVGRRGLTDTDVKAQVDRFLDSTRENMPYDVWMPGNVIRAYKPYSSIWEFDGEWPETSTGRQMMITAIAKRIVVKLELKLSCLFDFIQSKHTFPNLHLLSLWIDATCQEEIQQLQDVCLAPKLESIEFKYFPVHGGRPKDVTQWASAHGLPLLVKLCKAVHPRKLAVLFDHSMSKITSQHARVGVDPIKAGLDKEKVGCEMTQNFASG